MDYEDILPDETPSVVDDVDNAIHVLRLRTQLLQKSSIDHTVDIAQLKNNLTELQKELQNVKDVVKTMDTILNKAAVEMVPKFADAAENAYNECFSSIVHWMAGSILALIVAVIILFIKIYLK